MDFKSLASDWLLPAVGGYWGYGYGGATGAALGAGAGRFAGGYLKDEETGSQLKNAALAGAIGYGAGTGYDKLDFGGNFGSMGGGTSPAGSGGGISSGGGGFSSGIKNGISDFKVPIAMMGLSALANAYGAKEEQNNSEDVYQRQLSEWNQTAFPKAAVVDAQAASATSGINQQSMLARQRLNDQMAARGMGAGSGVIAGAMAEEDRARRNRLAQLANNLIQFKNTPMYAPPQYRGTSNTATGSLANNIGSSLGLGSGLMLQQALSGQNRNYQNEYYKRLVEQMGGQQ